MEKGSGPTVHVHVTDPSAEITGAIRDYLVSSTQLYFANISCSVIGGDSSSSSMPNFNAVEPLCRDDGDAPPMDFVLCPSRQGFEYVVDYLMLGCSSVVEEKAKKGGRGKKKADSAEAPVVYPGDFSASGRRRIIVVLNIAEHMQQTGAASSAGPAGRLPTLFGQLLKALLSSEGNRGNVLRAIADQVPQFEKLKGITVLYHLHHS